VEILWRGPFRLLDAGAAEVLEERDVAGTVAADDVGVAVAVPIKPDRRGERAAFQFVCLLLEIARRKKLRRVVSRELAGVLDERHAAVLVADDEVEVAVLVPINRHGRDHLQVHCERTG